MDYQICILRPFTKIFILKYNVLEINILFDDKSCMMTIGEKNYIENIAKGRKMHIW